MEQQKLKLNDYREHLRIEDRTGVDGIKQKFESLLDTSPTSFDQTTVGVIEGVYFKPGITTPKTKRYYSEKFWKDVLARPEVQESLASGKMLGLFEHPTGDPTKFSTREGLPKENHPNNTALITKSLKVVRNKNYSSSDPHSTKQLGIGKSYILNTLNGNLLNIFLSAKDESGMPLVDLYMSSRGYFGDGPIIRGVEQMDSKTYQLHSFDATMYPGVPGTKITSRPLFESSKNSVDELNYFYFKQINHITEKSKQCDIQMREMVGDLRLQSSYFDLWR